MTRGPFCRIVVATATLLFGVGGRGERAAAAEPEWPQFNGPRRDNLSTETGLLRRWPEGGPPLIWKADGLGHGFSSTTVADGRIYIAGNLDGRTVITALDLAGARLWQTPNGPAYEPSYPGARSTPTFAAGKVYHLNGDGDVICLDARTGRQIWTLNMPQEFGGRTTTWGLAESLLVDGQHLICCPGGPKVAIVALDKDTGKTVWTCAGIGSGIGDKPGYGSAVLVECGGLRQIVTMMSASAVGIAADTGLLLWRYEHKVAMDVNVATPIYRDGHLAIFGTWGRGATLLKLNVRGDACTVEEVWRTRELDNEHGGVVLVGGYLYGQADGNHSKRHWACLDWKTGKTMYSVEGLPTQRSGSVTYADGMIYALSDLGTVALVPADPRGFEIISQFRLPTAGNDPAWAHPVVCGGRLYLRHKDTLYAYDIRSPSGSGLAGW
jgi:outer membrane protein assembly factor BamB